MDPSYLIGRDWCVIRGAETADARSARAVLETYSLHSWALGQEAERQSPWWFVGVGGGLCKCAASEARERRHRKRKETRENAACLWIHFYGRRPDPGDTGGHCENVYVICFVAYVVCSVAYLSQPGGWL